MQYLLDKYGIELYNIYPFSLEDKVRELVGEVCFYKKKGEAMKKIKKSSFKYENPLLPEEVKTKKQAERFIAQEVAFMDLTSPEFNRHPLIYRSYKE